MTDNWQEIYPTVTGDPPEHLRFPVKFPYPHVSWATPRGKNCADISLPLPPMRQPTPVPDTVSLPALLQCVDIRLKVAQPQSLFTPYQHPSHLTAGTVNSAEARRETERHAEQRSQSQGSPPTQASKIDPYEEGLPVSYVQLTFDTYISAVSR